MPITKTPDNEEGAGVVDLGTNSYSDTLQTEHHNDDPQDGTGAYEGPGVVTHDATADQSEGTNNVVHDPAVDTRYEWPAAPDDQPKAEKPSAKKSSK